MSDEYDRTGWSTVITQKNAEIERLRREVEAWRADWARAVIDLDRLQALIDDVAEAVRLWEEAPSNERRNEAARQILAAEDALIAAATPQENKR
jgi:Zn-dependent oligopeptidase